MRIGHVVLADWVGYERVLASFHACMVLAWRSLMMLRLPTVFHQVPFDAHFSFEPFIRRNAIRAAHQLALTLIILHVRCSIEHDWHGSPISVLLSVEAAIFLKRSWALWQ